MDEGGVGFERILIWSGEREILGWDEYADEYKGE